MVDVANTVTQICEVLDNGLIPVLLCNGQQFLVLDAMQEMPDKADLKKQLLTPKVVLLAEEKDIFQVLASPHPDIVAILESLPDDTAITANDPIDIAEHAQQEDGTVFVQITRNPLLKALIKRRQKPAVLCEIAKNDSMHGIECAVSVVFPKQYVAINETGECKPINHQ